MVLSAVTKSGKLAVDTIDIHKVIVNFGGGINAYNVKYISKDDEIGILDKTMYSEVESKKQGNHIDLFFSSDIVKFIFLITQYASGAITQNEPLVANSITIPPDGVTDYYKFFDIEKHKQYVDDTLKQYDETKSKTKEPKQTRKKQPDKPKTDGGTKPKRKTRRKRWSLF